MKINIYQRYKITISRNGAYIDEENSTLTNINFKEFKNEIVKIMSGVEIIEYIEKQLKNSDISEVEFENNNAKIVYFNPINGEGEELYIKIEE